MSDMQNDIIPVLKTYPIRPDNSINLTPSALKEMGWPCGMHCQIKLNKSKGCIELWPANIDEARQTA